MAKSQTESERVTEWRKDKIAAGDRVITVRLSKQAADKLDALRDAHGGVRVALEKAIKEAKLK